MERLQALLAANQAFYDAFEGRDRAAMSALWEHSERATCTHPGWPALRGWPAVAASWDAILGGPRPEQFVLTDLRASIVGEAGWVTLDENLLGGTSTVSAINLFVDAGEGWRMVAHHASPVLRG
jgi:hypothetical protein